MLTRNDERTMVFDSRFAGLPEIVHGGYLAGVLATQLAGTGAEVRLRRPAAVARCLAVERAHPELLELRDGDTLLADAVPAELSLDVPLPATLAEAEAAARRFPGVHGHPFPRCFACGSERVPGDGLRIFTGPVTSRRLVAAPWVPAVEDGLSGRVPEELVWAALDCAQLWALIAHPPAGAPEHVVTASLEARLDRPVLAGEAHVVIGWPIGRDGRRVVAGAAVLGPGGEPCAVGRQVAASAGWGVPLGWLAGTQRSSEPTKGGNDA